MQGDDLKSIDTEVQKLFDAIEYKSTTMLKQIIKSDLEPLVYLPKALFSVSILVPASFAEKKSLNFQFQQANFLIYYFPNLILLD